MIKFDSTFFKNNRVALSASIPNTFVVLAGHAALQYSADEPYPFRQESNFWYLSGINEPDLVLTINTATTESILYIPEQNEYQKTWDGVFNEAAYAKLSGVDKVMLRSELEGNVTEAHQKGLKIATITPSSDRIEPYGFYANPAKKLLYEEIKLTTNNPYDVRLDIARLRQIKQPNEIKAINDAIAITAAAITDIKENKSDFLFEHEIATKLQILFLQKGGDGHKFQPIVASGENAATLHYNDNDKRIENNALLLLDIGASCGMYGADISRVMAIGNPSKRQKDVHEALREVQESLLLLIKPGMHFKELQELANKTLSKQYSKLGIQPRELPHGLSHFLGIDTHDAGDYSLPLLPNTIMTVEPGIYLPDEGIGVRIEDNILVTEKGIELLSKKINYDL